MSGRVDNTLMVGRFYIDMCGGIQSHFSLGFTLAWDRNTYNCWGRRVSLDLGFWTLSIGWD